MAKARARKTFRRRSGYKFYKRIYPNQYFRVKAEFMDTIRFAPAGGQPFFVSRIAEPLVADRSFITNQLVLNGYSYIQILAGLFSYYKLLGIRLEVIPEARNTNLDPQIGQVQVYLSYRAASALIQTLQEVKANNRSLVLDPLSRQTRYWKGSALMSGDYYNTNQWFSGAWTTLSSDPGQYADQPSWQIKISYYLLYKGSKA